MNLGTKLGLETIWHLPAIVPCHLATSTYKHVIVVYLVLGPPTEREEQA